MTLDPLHAHPMCAVLPMLPDDHPNYVALKHSIASSGQFHPIVISTESPGLILAGRHRLRACLELGREPVVVPFADLRLAPGDDGLPITEGEFAFHENFSRRDLTQQERDQILISFHEHLMANPRGAPNGNRNASKQRDQSVPLKKGKTRANLAKATGVSERQARKLLEVAREPQLYDEVKRGKTTLNEASKAVRAKKTRNAPVGRAASTAEPEEAVFDGSTERSDSLAASQTRLTPPLSLESAKDETPPFSFDGGIEARVRDHRDLAIKNAQQVGLLLKTERGRMSKDAWPVWLYRIPITEGEADAFIGVLEGAVSLETAMCSVHRAAAGDSD